MKQNFRPAYKFYTAKLLVIMLSLSMTELSLAKSDAPHRYIEIHIGEGAGKTIKKHEERKIIHQYNHKAHDYYNRPIRERLRRLEMAVRELQGEVWELRRDNERLKAKQHRFACYIQTPFDGTFLGRGATRIEATALALNQCEAKAQSWCKEQRVKCDRA